MPVTNKGIRLAKVAREINVGIDTITEHLKKKGFNVESRPTTKLSPEMYNVLLADFKQDVVLKERADHISFRTKRENIEISDLKNKGVTKEDSDLEFLLKTTTTFSEKEEPVKQPKKETKPIPKIIDEVIEEKPKTQVIEPIIEALPIVEDVLPTLPPPPTLLEEVIEEPSLSVVEKTVEETIPVVEPQEFTSLPDTITSPVIKDEVLEPIESRELIEEISSPEPIVEEVIPDESIVKQEEVLAIESEQVITEEKKEEASEKKPPIPKEELFKAEVEIDPIKVVGKIELDNFSTKKKKKTLTKRVIKGRKSQTPKPEKKREEPVKKAFEKKSIEKPVPEPEKQVEKRTVPKLQGPKIVGKISLPTEVERSEKKKEGERKRRKRKRKRIVKPEDQATTNTTNKETETKPPTKRVKKSVTKSKDRDKRKKRGRRKVDNKAPEVTEKEIQDKIKATMAKLTGGTKGKSARAKLRRKKKEQAAEGLEETNEVLNVLSVTEFVSVNELATLMEVSVNDVITQCFNLGVIVSINQRLDAEVIELVAEEFNFEVEFISVSDEDEEIEDIEDAPEDLKPRPPIVTIMGHVDHGKTSLLDYIRSANVIAGEVGGITQHIGAYEVMTESGREITFLDTPGHEAFTAMRARGAKVTDIAVIVVSADDSVMPQTKEAISHAQAAGVPMVFAINKIDKMDANPERIKEQLANMNILVEDWGGSFQSQEISAKEGTNVADLLEKILLEADLLELSANPDRPALGTIVEASLDKGRGYLATMLVQKGTLKVGDVMVAGQYSGKVKAMYNERGVKIKKAGPSAPALVLGLNGAPQAGDKVRVMESEQEAKLIATRREQIVREQSFRATKHITLEEIGRRLALGNFKELNLIVKGDVDGSVEALSDSLLQLSTDEIRVNIIHRSVGPIKESDVLLASASDAIIIGFQVRPSPNARRKADHENIDIRLYSIIYAAIDEIKAAMEGMLEPTVEERFVCNIEVRDVFKITKVGKVAGCYVLDGKVSRDTKVRVVREGIVIYTGELSSLKRFKDDVKDVQAGMECGLTVKNYSDLKIGDIIEGYEEYEIKRKL